MNSKICDLFKTEEFTVELHVEDVPKYIRLLILDSDNRYVDDWTYMIGEDISGQIENIRQSIRNGYDGFVKLVSNCFDKKIYSDLDVEEYHDKIKQYGREYVNRIGGYVLVTKE